MCLTQVDYDCNMTEKRIHRRTFNENGHAHELTFSTFHRFPFLSKDRTSEWLAQSIREACNQLDFSLWAFVFMPDHVHLIVMSKNPRCEISRFLAQVKNPVSRKALAYLRRESRASVY